MKTTAPGSIAVMLFKNLSNDVEQEYFCEGFSEDLLIVLSRFNKLMVISSNSSFAYRDKVKSLSEIGSELGVQYIIKGSVRKLGNKINLKQYQLLYSQHFILYCFFLIYCLQGMMISGIQVSHFITSIHLYSYYHIYYHT